MKLNGRDGARFCDSPDPKSRGALIHGADPVEVSERRKALVKAILGDDGDADLRLTRISGAEARKDGALVFDALKARGFFAGRQIVLVEDATDTAIKSIETALATSEQDDAFLLITAGSLTAKSKLRKLFEASKSAAAVACYGDKPDRGALSDMLLKAGAKTIDDEASRDLADLSEAMDIGAIHDLVERIALTSLDNGGHVTADDVIACAPISRDAEIDDAIGAVFDGRADEIGPMMARLEGQGLSATAIAIGASRYAKRMLVVLAAIDEGSPPDQALSRLRPPAFGPRRDQLMRRCRRWGLNHTEGALRLLLETDNELRGRAGLAGYAILERAFLKLAITASRLR